MGFHAVTALQGITLGVSGGPSNPSALNYCISPSSQYVLETNLKNYTLHAYNKVDGATALACQKTLASGADLSVKADVSGSVDIAHVSNLSDGIKLTLGTSFNALNFGSAAPTFGAGFEFSF